MNQLTLLSTIAALVIAPLALAQTGGGGSGGTPPSQEWIHRYDPVRTLLKQGDQQMSQHQYDEAVTVFTQAQTLEDQISATWHERVSSASASLARALVAAGRENDALVAYRHAFWWNERTHDIDMNGGEVDPLVLSYALLLAKHGEIEEAKAMYYYALRQFNGPMGGDKATRGIEPIPFLVVFDPEPEGIPWDYSFDRFKAAILLVKGMIESKKDFFEQARELVPDSFYPVILLADKQECHHRDAMITQAEAFARPGLERDLIAQYRTDLAEFLHSLDEQDLATGTDDRPMNEGNRRRSHMTCLQPNEQLLRRISRGGSG